VVVTSVVPDISDRPIPPIDFLMPKVIITKEIGVSLRGKIRPTKVQEI
jgi:hypothetical protein